MLDLTVYLMGPTVEELTFLIDLYRQLCPPGRFTRYTIAELSNWQSIGAPTMTSSARRAAARGLPAPALEPVRNRIRDGRAYELRFWDGRPIDDPEGSWSFSTHRIHLRERGLRAYVRFLVPITTDPDILETIAVSVADYVNFYSGHGGLVFAYNPWHKDAAFDIIFALSRRFWCVDIEDLNGTLIGDWPGIKAVNWITMLGRDFDGLNGRIAELGTSGNLHVHVRRQGSVMKLGSAPVSGDVNRLNGIPYEYFSLSQIKKSLILKDHPDFVGSLFGGRTVDWLHRFVAPNLWR